MVVLKDRQTSKCPVYLRSRSGRVEARLDGETYAVRFPYDPEAIAVARGTLPGARWDPEAKAWRVKRRHHAVLIDRLECIDEVFDVRLAKRARRLDAARGILEAARPWLREDPDGWILEAPYDLRIVDLARAAGLRWVADLGLRKAEDPDVDALVALARELPELASAAMACRAAKVVARAGKPGAQQARRLVRASGMAEGDILLSPEGVPGIVTHLGKSFTPESAVRDNHTADQADAEVRYAYLRPATPSEIAARAAEGLPLADREAMQAAGFAAVDLVARGTPVPAFDHEMSAEVLWQSTEGEAAQQVCIEGPWIVHLSWDSFGPEKTIAAARVPAHPEIVAAIKVLAALEV